MEKLLLMNLPDATYRTIQGVASRLRIATDRIEQEYFGRTLKTLASGKYRQSEDTAESKDAGYRESLIVLCGLRDKRLDKVLFEFKRAEVNVDYKAILTPINENWTVPALMGELRREKAAIQMKKFF
ncbi:MAG: DUF3783 domain-containing protein [Lachnospiraceae bacterium]